MRFLLLSLVIAFVATARADLDALRQALPASAALLTWIDVSMEGIEEHWGCVVRNTGEPLWERLPGTGAGMQWTPQDRNLPGRLLLALTGDRTTAPSSAAEVASLTKALDDAATALLMDRFYQNLTGKREGLKGALGKAEALAEAKDWLRNLSLEEATQRLGTITKGVSRGTEQEALKEIKPPVGDPKANPKEVKPFAHPRYWAAFVLIGDPN
jgi:hypothetical protein